MSELKIEDYLHLYYHSKGELTTLDDVVCEGRVGTLMSQFLPSHIKTIKPILRPLSDMTEMEAVEVAVFYYGTDQPRELEYAGRQLMRNFMNPPDQWKKHWEHPGKLLLLGIMLVRMGFDLFGLIDAKLALDKTQLNK